MILKDKKITLGITGAISAYKALELARLLVKKEATVLPVMTKSAAEFITPLSLSTISRNSVFSNLFEPESYVKHIELAQSSDLIIVAPATANIIGKIASGIADDALTTIVAASRVPVLIAPSMNTRMWENPVVKDNVGKLKRLGYLFVGPEEGELACGYEGPGRLSEVSEILEAAEQALSPKDLKGEKVLVTAGATREAIDPVRFVSNASSGRMGYEIARAAKRRGAEVVLVSGPSHLPRPGGVAFVKVLSAEEMYEASIRYFPQSTLVIMAAAVSDYRPVKSSPTKVKKETKLIELQLERTQDVLKYMGGHKKEGQFLVGFALETENLEENAKKKLKDKNLDLVVANYPWGLDSEINEVVIINRDEEVEVLPPLRKEEVADIILNTVQKQRSL